MLGLLKKIFPSKKDKDRKFFAPYVQEALAQYARLATLTDDQLRAKTAEVQDQLKQAAANVQQQLTAKQQEIEANRADVARVERLFDEIDRLKKERNKVLEAKLLEVMPLGFAIVKETCRRLTENKQLVVTATDFDREYAQTHPHVRIEGEQAIWSSTWAVMGHELTWEMVHYDVQLFGGAVLHTGRIAEMATGEGKTLVSTLPAFLNGLLNRDFGLSVHLVTVNDYLARRDSQWNGPVFAFHGLTVDCIDNHPPNTEARRSAYQAAIVYGTNNEFGFDYLRDNMVTDPSQLVQRELHFAMIDEVDSVLVDEARTPLIIAGPVPEDQDRHEFNELKPRIETLMALQKKVVHQCLIDAKKAVEQKDDKKAGLLLFRAHRGLPKYGPLIKYLSEGNHKLLMQKAEAIYLADNQKRMPEIDAELYFTIDEKNNDIELTHLGREAITRQGEDPDLFVLPDVAAEIATIENDTALTKDEKNERRQHLARLFAEKSERLHSLSQLLKAYTLFERDVEYIVDDGKVVIVDENTGRVMPGRRYSDGLHQAIEAKENVKIEAATQTYATITLQNYFLMYHKLAGMTGTAETEAVEFNEIYKLDVVVIDTHRKVIRKDKNDLVYRTKREKFNAIIDEIQRLTTSGRPVLVGTTSVEVSELLSRMLKQRKIEHNVLNAKQHLREAEIVAEAGFSGRVTIATNMAGRGTDIKLGPGVREAGGLAIIGSERHESRRIDRQLRGRAGRQGDPGSSQFFLSLEDDLMRMFGSERLANFMEKWGAKEGEVLEAGIVTRSISSAQKKVEENNFAIRKRLLEYDRVMNGQRKVVYALRRNALFGDRLQIDLDNMIERYAEHLVSAYYENRDVVSLTNDCLRTLGFDPQLTEQALMEYKADQIAEHIYNTARQTYDATVARVCTKIYEFVEQIDKNGIPNHPGKPQSFVAVFVRSDDKLALQFPIQAILETKGLQIYREFEKFCVLEAIDEHWKHHLRDMDDLKQSVQTARFEQKDPMREYVRNAALMFGKLLVTINQQVLSYLFTAEIEGLNEATLEAVAFNQAAAPFGSPVPPPVPTQPAPSSLPTFDWDSAEEPQAQESAVSRAERRKQEKQGLKKRKF
jgi:preprotein translocase subunit SecA